MRTVACHPVPPLRNKAFICQLPKVLAFKLLPRNFLWPKRAISLKITYLFLRATCTQWFVDETLQRPESLTSIQDTLIQGIFYFRAPPHRLGGGLYFKRIEVQLPLLPSLLHRCHSWKHLSLSNIPPPV